MTRLATQDKELEALILGLDGSGQRRVAFLACEYAMEALGEESPVLISGLNHLRNGVPYTPEQRAEIEAAARELDLIYLELGKSEENGPDIEREYTAAFHRARFAMAVASAGSADSLEAALDAVYEAAFAFEEPTDLWDALRKTL